MSQQCIEMLAVVHVHSQEVAAARRGRCEGASIPSQSDQTRDMATLSQIRLNASYRVTSPLLPVLLLLLGARVRGETHRGGGNEDMHAACVE